MLLSLHTAIVIVISISNGIIIILITKSELIIW